MTEQAQSSSRGWIVTFAALGINLVLGVLYAWSVMAGALIDRWKWSRTDASMPFAVATASFAVTMIFAGRVQDRLGPRGVAMVGGALLGLGMIASAWAESPLVMSLTFGVIGGMGIGLGYSATTPASIKWFPPARKGLITGIVVSGVGLAAVYMAPLTKYLLGAFADESGDKARAISRTFLILGIGTIAVVGALAQIVRNPPAGYVPAGAAPSGPAPGGPAKPSRAGSGRNADWNEMLGTPQFYMLWAMFILAAAPGLMLIANAVKVAQEQAEWAKPEYLPMILAIFNTLGRIVGGVVSDRIGRSRTLVLFFLLQSLNMFLFSRYTTQPLIIFGAAFTGVCYGTIFTLMPAAIADYYGVKNLGVNYGLLFTGFGVAGVLGSLVGGRVRDLLGSYTMAYSIMGIMVLVAAVLALVIRAPKAPAEPPAAKPEPAKAAV